MPNPPQKILVIRLRGIGDVVLTTPVLENLRRAFPRARIDYLTEPPSAPLLQIHPAITTVHVLEHKRWRKLPGLAALRANLDFIRTLREQNYDLVIDLFGNPRTALLTYLTRAALRVGFRFRVRRFAYNRVVEPRGAHLHAAEFHLDALRALQIPIATSQPRIAAAVSPVAEKFWQEHRITAHDRVIAFNAFGGWHTKRWPLASFAELGDRLQRELGAKVILLWGPGELEEVRHMAAMMRTPALIAPPTSLNDLTALLDRVNLLVANDSGPMHLAAALQTPVLAIFGPTRPDLQGPLGEGHVVVTKEGLPCLGCNGLTCKIATHDCMQKLSVETVFHAVSKRIAEVNRMAD
jgi:lipopolysaccharide heptosyltransferase I